MSYDIYLVKKGYPSTEGINITWNVSNMLSECGWHPTDKDGATVEDEIEPLRKAIKDMDDRPDHYRKFNAPNGWGTYEHTLEALKTLLTEMEAYPAMNIRVS